jgi:methionyl-tRNA formyltransferase
MSGFRFVMITQEDPFYVRVFFEEFLRQYSDRAEIAAVVVAPAMGKRGMVALARQMLQFYGPRDFVRVGLRFVAYKLGSRLPVGATGRCYSIDQCCAKHGVKVLRARDLNSESFLAQLRSLQPDLVVSVAAPQIFQRPLIELPRLGCINIHNSMLPKYRGMLPNFWQLFHGEESTGITVHRINSALDDGEIILQVASPVEPGESLDALIVKTKRAGAALMCRAIAQLRDGTAVGKLNPQSDGSYFSFPTCADVRAFRQRGYRLL